MFGGIENVYHELRKHPEWVSDTGVKEAGQKKLLEGEEDARLSRVLGEIHCDVPIEFALPEKSWKESAHSDEALALVNELEFRSLSTRVKQLFAASTAALFEEQEEEARPAVPERELNETALAVSVLDSSIAEPTFEDIHRLGKSKDFETARKNIFAELKEKKLEFVYEKIELPLVPVLRRMEERGVLVDRTFLAKLSKEYGAELKKIAQRIYTQAGGEFNVGSPKQLSEVLFGKLGLQVKNHKKTAGGTLSTRESELAKMRDLHPIVGEILDYRELSKLLSS